MIFVDVDNGYKIKDYLIDETAKCSDVINELTEEGTLGYRLCNSYSGTVLNEELSLKDQGISSGYRLRLRRV